MKTNLEFEAEKLADIICEHTTKVLEGPKVEGRFSVLEERIARLERGPQLKWCGTYTPGMDYSEASLCTHAGGLWLATKPTDSTPGSANASWKLIVKSGKA